MITVEVIILNWNGADMLARFLPSVVAATTPRTTVGVKPAQIGIVVADNGSTDGSAEWVGRNFPSVRVVELDRNYGFAEGYNRALGRRADGGSGHAEQTDYYILLNSDVETPAGWCEPLIEMLATHPDVAAVAPKVLSHTRRDTFEYAGASGGFIDSLGYPFCRGRILGTVERDHGQYDDAREIFWATGACMACRADVFHTLGGFDGRFFAHQEEIDLCWRMQSAGWRVMVEPRSTVYHLGAGTLPPSPRKLYLNYRNNLAMLYKNLPPARMQAVVAMRSVLNALASVLYLVCGEGRNFAAVWRAHRDFLRMVRGGLRESRREIQARRIADPTTIRRTPILLSYLIGRRRFTQL